MISPAKFLNFTSPPNSGNHRFLHYRKVHFPSPMNAETIHSSRPSLILLGYPRFCCSSLPFRFEGMSSPSIPVARKLVLRPAALAEGDANDGLSSVDVRSNHSGFQDCSPEVSDTSVEKGILQQVKDIVMFAGPALGLWICGPMMSLIDTAVVGQSSSVELAALGPGTVVCDNMSYIFMFLSIATSNMVATALARKDREEAQQHISMLLFVALSCGFGMLFLMKFFGAQILTAFVGVKNSSIIPAANSYVQIRGFAWPAVLVGMVAQSASLAMKDSFGPLKVLIIASIANGFGDLMLCSFWHYGIAGAAWATMASQFVAAFLMIESLSRTGFSVFSLAIPSSSELLQIFELAAPIFVTMLSKIAFYSLLTYFATSMGTITLAAHQVMLGVLCMWTVWGEPISQTAQSFMPELIYGVNWNLKKARMLLKSLMIIGICTGCLLGTVGTLVPSLFPYLFTRDPGVVAEMQTVLFPYFVALSITPAIHSLEGSLLAGRDLRFLSFSMSGCFCLGGILLAVICSKGYGLPGCWWTLAIFQWARFLLSLQRLLSPKSMLFAEEPVSEKFSKLKAV